MDVCKINDANCIAKAAATLQAGGVILYPTDTLYGLGADALSDEAVEKVRAIKGRENGKPIHAIFADLDSVGEYAEVNDFARMLAKRYLPGPLTLVLKKRKEIQAGIARDIDTIGVRIPQNKFCRALAREFGRPFTTTSANKSGKSPEHSVKDIVKQLGRGAKKIDLAIDAGELPPSEPSTVIDLTGTRPIILREGAIAAGEIWDELGVGMRE
ncbi:threonylcarbamoyl-AMP synthase [Candidatus Kaiserbacteria bacterium GWA2_50_9]|uniref:L-threonylcarbamoyladenylate synthase n=1 Tax=Candidatus Kaiserbacteria bacterium GWA2_50_9 TaxID=1798474 RepID=A0A1F6BW52_9BACT|nr:MAG: threonylcarbamoyl-AMP synthase [Candidatus Kaiserbacteria bacterium GWA2_50_9]